MKHSTIYKKLVSTINFPPPSRRKSPRKDTSGDPRCKCSFTVGQIIQHKKRPTIKYMLVADPVSTKRKQWWGSHRVTMWKLKLFSLRNGKLGGRVITRLIAPTTIKDYVVISDVDLPALLPPPGLTSETGEPEQMIST